MQLLLLEEFTGAMLRVASDVAALVALEGHHQKPLLLLFVDTADHRLLV